MLVHAEFYPTGRAERRIGGDSNVLVLAESDEGFLRKVWMDLNLEDGRLDTSVAEDVEDQGTLAVAESSIVQRVGPADSLAHAHT